eukprot:10379627-Lingulodinium_polyedra.AAC.1
MASCGRRWRNLPAPTWHSWLGSRCACMWLQWYTASRGLPCKTSPGALRVARPRNPAALVDAEGGR